MKLLFRISCLLVLFLSVSLYSSAQEQHSDPYIVDFESDYPWNATYPHYPRCWVIWNGMNAITGGAAHGDRYIGQTTGQGKVQMYSCYFYATTADTFSFYYQLRRSGGAGTNINDFTPYVGYFRYGDMNVVDDAVWMDTLTFAAGNTWYYYSSNFQYDGYQKVVIYADNDYFFNWLNDSETGFRFDYFVTSAIPSYEGNPQLNIRLKTGSATACQNETRTYVADTILNYVNPPHFELQWRVNGVLRKTSYDPADSLFEHTSNTIDTVVASFSGIEFCHPNTNPTSVSVRDTLYIGECREISITGKNKIGVCPEETVRFNFSASPPDNWPDGNTTQIFAQLSALDNPDWSSPDTLTGGSVDLDNGSITGAFPEGKSPGKYYIRLIANDPLQTTSLNYDSVELYALPDTSLIDVSDVTTCEGDSTYITIQNTQVDVRYILSSGVSPVDTIFGDGTDQTLRVYATTSTTLNVNAKNMATQCFSDASKSIQVDVVTKPTISERTYTVYYEEDTIIGVNLSGGTPPYAYSWEPDSLVAGQQNLPNPRTLPLHISQNIYVTVTDDNGCEGSSYAYLNVKGSPLQVVIEGNENSPNPDAGQPLETAYDMTGHSNNTNMCQGDSIYLSAMIFGGSENYTLEWRKIEQTTTLITGSPYILVTSPPVPSQYVLIVDDGDIVVTDTFYVQQVFEVAPALAEPDTFLFPNAQLQLHGTLLPPGNPLTASYRWEPAEFLDNPDIPDPMVIMGEENIDFVLTVTDINGCKSRDTASIRFREFQIFVPSAFTPNKDGINDSVSVRGFGVNEILFRIYNRWGELVFETDQWYPEEYRSAAWNGVYKGVLQHTQTFGYFLRAKTLAGDTYEETGTITILK